jgi:hypothetical protein
MGIKIVGIRQKKEKLKEEIRIRNIFWLSMEMSRRKVERTVL